MEHMTITYAKYVLDYLSNKNTAVNCIIDGLHMSVPCNPANRHYAEIMRQVEAGELVIQEADT